MSPTLQQKLGDLVDALARLVDLIADQLEKDS